MNNTITIRLNRGIVVRILEWLGIIEKLNDDCSGFLLFLWDGISENCFMYRLKEQWNMSTAKFCCIVPHTVIDRERDLVINQWEVSKVTLQDNA